ncbi:MAG: peptidase U32 family protein [Thermodesulfobacteriota bacterium]|nr:MAG: peptidase U32 family protein [Thermodesulfobacteriota bacterium]
MSEESEKSFRPTILAPAGNKASFLAALAASADEIYCGLRQFSARMEARNFSIEELVPLTLLAHDKGVKVYVALNALLKPNDLNIAGELLQQLERRVKPDGIIIQDLGFVQLARQTGFSGELHFSTLSNVSFPAAIQKVKKSFGVHRVVLPRELNIDEIKAMATACPKGLGLEVFVHGALCYGVSGRCYWSSYFGGKSGLRGRCVQPCRRIYKQNEQKKRFFSCQDLSLDVLVKVLRTIPQIRTWKIEGRKKGPHTVFYTVKAYRILRDHGTDPKMKKEALHMLSYALGRSGTHYNFLPQRPQNPVRINNQTGSGLFVGAVKGTKQKPFLNPKEALLSGDLLRLGYEDELWHGTIRVGKYVPKGGRLFLKPILKKSPEKKIPVFLIDRQEKDLEDMVSKLEKELPKTPVFKSNASVFVARQPKTSGKKKGKILDLRVYRRIDKTKLHGTSGLWLSDQGVKKLPKRIWTRIWWWLPPVIWPDDEQKLKGLVDSVLSNGAKIFVLNAPWQTTLFTHLKEMNLWAGPFCNIANVLALKTLASLGYKGAIVIPELGQKDFLSLPKQSPLPLGIVLSGNWPLCISRALSNDLETETSFTSPKGESAWVKKFESDYWVFPNWKLDLSINRKALEKAGFRLFVHLLEPIPKKVKLKRRPGLWNWDLELL